MAAIHRENGADGIWFSPRAPEEPTGFDEPRRASIALGLARGVDEAEWIRLWHAVDDRGRVVGDVNLRGNRLTAEQHRCTLGIGLLATHRGRGLGRALLATAVDWAKSQAVLEWVDLGVFDGNAPAIRLYESFGFVRWGAVEDRFRVRGVSVADVQMALRLRAETRGYP